MTSLPTLQVVSSVAEKNDDATAWLRFIHDGIIRASEDLCRTRRIEQLLEIASTLTMIGDAARIDWNDASRLIGQPREPARIPLLLKELELRVAALVALGGTDIASLKELIGMAEYPALIDGAVIQAMDDIVSALSSA